MSTAAGNLLGAIQGAQGSQTESTGALAQVGGALQGAHQAFAASGGNDKVALLNAIDEKYRIAQGASQEAVNALEEMMRLATAVAEGQVGLLPTADGGTITHPAARPVKPGSTRWQRPLPPEPTPAENRKQFFDSALTPERVRDLLAQLPDKAAEDAKHRMSTKTRGFWIKSDGTAQPVVSGKHDLTYEVAHQYWRGICDNVQRKHPDIPDEAWEGIRTAAHAEIKAAIQLHTEHRNHGAVVINHPTGPCNGKPLACEELLRHYLRKGQTMTIYWPNGHMIIRGEA